MYPKNASSPPAIAVGAIYLLADGTQVTSGASVRVKTGTGSWGAGGGTLSCDSTSGTWEYTPTQAETNAASFMVAVYKAACTQATITVVTTASDTAGYGGLDWGLVRQASTAVNLSATTFSTSQQVASVSGNVGGSVASVTGAVGSVTGSVGGNVAGSVGSISGVTFPTNFGVLGINSSGHVSRVVLCDTTTTNSDMRGTDGAALASAWTATRAGYLDSVLIAANSNRTVLVTGSNHVAAVVHDAEPDSIPEDAFITGALSARVIASNAITAAKVASDVSDEIAATVNTVLSASHGAGAWGAQGSGSGAYTLTITVTDGAIPLQNATVRVAEGVTALTQTTNASGIATFAVDAATWAVAITKGGYSFTPTTLVVSGNQSQTYAMTAVVIPSPPSAATSTVAVTCYNELTTIESGAKLYVKQTGVPAGSTDTAYDGTEKEYTANGSGLVVLTLWRNATYQIRRGTSKQAQSFTPTTATYSISSIIGSP